MISLEDFQKVEMRVGKVVSAQEVKDSTKLLRLKVDFGKPIGTGEKIIFSAIKKWYQPEDLEGNLYIFIYNLEPRKMMGEESQGMIVAAEDETGENCVLLIPDKDIKPGTKVV